jgi:hypothetical protein
MCTGVRFQIADFAPEVLKPHRLLISQGEARVNFSQTRAVLPVLYRGQALLLPWGNRLAEGVPRTGYCTFESFQSGKWQWLHPEPVTILASAGLSQGTWFQVRQGISGIVVKDPRGGLHCYMMTQPSTHYFRTMTGADRMPLLIHQVL